MSNFKCKENCSTSSDNYPNKDSTILHDSSTVDMHGEACDCPVCDDPSIGRSTSDATARMREWNRALAGGMLCAHDFSVVEVDNHTGVELVKCSACGTEALHKLRPDRSTDYPTAGERVRMKSFPDVQGVAEGVDHQILVRWDGGRTTHASATIIERCPDPEQKRGDRHG